MPAYSIPYFTREALRFDDPSDNASSKPLQNAVRYEWIYPLGETITALLTAGLTLRWLHEHDSVAFQRYNVLVKDAHDMYRWPDKRWLPLSYWLRAERVIGNTVGQAWKGAA